MFKVVLFLHLFISALNCENFKCDMKEIKDLQTNTIFPDKNEFCKDKICVFRLCGLPNMMILAYKNNTKKCANVKEAAKVTNQSVQIQVYKKDYSKKWELSERGTKDFRYVVYKQLKKYISNKTCINNPSVISGDERLLENGSLFWKPNMPVLNSHEYIVEFQMKETADNRWIGPLIYTRVLTVDVDLALDYYRAIGMIISCVFLILVLVIYYMFKNRRGQYGKIFMAYIASSTISFAVNATHKLGLDLGAFDDTGCKCITSVFYFTTLTPFFWLNVMSYEIWSSFRPKNVYRSTKSREHNHKFLMASLYAFGTPLLMLAVVVLIDELDLMDFKPQFKHCMRAESRKFFYVPITIILCINLLFFIVTAYRVWQMINGKTLHSSESRITRRNRNNFTLYIKLSISTGLNWFLDIIGIYVTLPNYLNYIFDTYAVFLGVILFIICVCNKKVLILLSKRFNINRFENNSSINTTKTQNNKKTASTKENTAS